MKELWMKFNVENARLFFISTWLIREMAKCSRVREMSAVKRRKLNMFVQLSENFLLPFWLFLLVLIRYISAAAQLHDSHGRAHCLFFLSDHFHAPRLRIAFAVCATAVFELYIIGRDFFFFLSEKCSAVVGLSVLSFFTFARGEHILLPFFPCDLLYSSMGCVIFRGQDWNAVQLLLCFVGLFQLPHLSLLRNICIKYVKYTRELNLICIIICSRAVVNLKSDYAIKSKRVLRWFPTARR